jgi:hypothetical protein
MKKLKYFTKRNQCALNVQVNMWQHIVLISAAAFVDNVKSFDIRKLKYH